MPIKVLIVDDHEVVREAVARLLTEAELTVVGHIGRGKDTLAAVRELKPDLVLLDIRLPDMDGFTVLEQLRSQADQVKVLMLTSYDHPVYLARAAALHANGVLPKATNRDILIEAIHNICRGEDLWASDELQRDRITPLTACVDANHEVRLTLREADVLRRVSQGLSNKEIGSALGISFDTVKASVEDVLRKIGVGDRTQAAIWAMRNIQS